MPHYTYATDWATTQLLALKAKVDARIIDAAEVKDENEVMTSWHLHELLESCQCVSASEQKISALRQAAGIIYPVVDQALGLKWNEAMANRLSIDQNCILALRQLENEGL